MPQLSLDCIHQNVLLPTSCFLVPSYWKTRPFSHLAHVVWFSCLKWFKIKWVQTIHLHGVSSCIYTNRHGSHVSIFSKTSESKDPSTWSFFMCFIPIWLKWQCHKYVVPLQKNALPWWYMFVTVGRVFCHACTSMTNLWQNQDSHTCAVVEVFHDITKIIITKVSTSMTINRVSQKCFRQGWLTRGIHHNGMPLSYRVRFWIR